MSICRWSSDSFRCDLYIYGAEDGMVIHVGGNRPMLPADVVAPDIGDPDWVRKHREFMDHLHEADREPIGLPHDNESFYGLTEEEMWAKVIELVDIGYRVPDYVLTEARKAVSGEAE